MAIPVQVSESLLYKKLAQDTELAGALPGIRTKADLLSESLIRDAGMFTDHTVRHMDALWTVTQTILTSVEIDRMTPAEAFLLGVGFYLHDLGMSYAATTAGRERLMATAEYKGVYTSAQGTPEENHFEALAHAIRIHHANAAEELAAGPIPGTNDFLIEPSSIRDQFGEHCGKIAASHHWSIDKVEAELGNQEVIPLASNRVADLGYVAGVLRLVDYAHINRDRAPKLAREIRPGLSEISAAHWDAQQDIDGPLRNTGDNELVYSSASKLKSVDAWWLYYEFARGLDNEIRQVRRFLGKRRVSVDRLSLIGVRSADSPEDFAKLIKPDGFLPLEISVRASSITRLVSLLAGESLYGKNFMAPARELVQNAVDAMVLKQTIAVSPADKAVGQLPIEVKLFKHEDDFALSVRDWGIGMNRKVIVNHLLTIASDYWESQFHTDFPQASETFKPVGRFGIGFLSVFMLGDKITVASQRAGDVRHELTVRGLGRRAELRQITSDNSSGTTVTVLLKKDAANALMKDFSTRVESYFPLLHVPIGLDVLGVTTTIPVGWLSGLDKLAFKKWVLSTTNYLSDGEEVPLYRYRFGLNGSRVQAPEDEQKQWPAGVPEYCESGVRLLADSSGITILTLRGFTLQVVGTPGFSGIIDTIDVTPDASRRRGLNFSSEAILSRARIGVANHVAENLSSLASTGFVSEKTKFVSWCCRSYGDDVVTRSSFPWIQLIERSGNSRFISSADFDNLLTTRESLFLAFGAGTNATSSHWFKRRKEFPASDIAICFADLPQLSIGYNTSSETKEGTFREILPEFEREPLVMLFLRSIEKAWGTRVNELVSTDNWVHIGSEVTGWLTKAPKK